MAFTSALPSTRAFTTSTWQHAQAIDIGVLPSCNQKRPVTVVELQFISKFSRFWSGVVSDSQVGLGLKKSMHHISMIHQAGYCKRCDAVLQSEDSKWNYTQASAAAQLSITAKIAQGDLEMWIRTGHSHKYWAGMKKQLKTSLEWPRHQSPIISKQLFSETLNA